MRKPIGGGEVAPADGMRFVVPVRTVHAGSNPKYFGTGRDVTWYPWVPASSPASTPSPLLGTLRDSLVLLAVVLNSRSSWSRRKS